MPTYAAAAIESAYTTIPDEALKACLSLTAMRPRVTASTLRTTG
ncbi:MAG: hypothetical protein R2706_02650 [Acidimicrobiales bacterium]